MTQNPSRSYSNYQDLIKTIAIIVMFLDHAKLFMMVDGFWIRAIGRGVLPVFCFFAGYNFTKPKHVVGLLGVILTYISYFSQAFDVVALNVLAMIYLGQWYLYFMDKWKCNSDAKVFMQCVILLALAPLVRDWIDYGTLGIAIMVIGKLAGEGRDYKRFMPLLGISTIIFCMLDYSDYFSITDIALVALVIAGVFFALAKVNLKTPISIDLRFISRHSLWIYFFNYGGHMLWFYYTISHF